MKSQHHTWAYLSIAKMLMKLVTGPRLSDGVVQINTPSGGTVFMNASGINNVPANAHKVDCSLIVPRR